MTAAIVYSNTTVNNSTHGHYTATEDKRRAELSSDRSNAGEDKVMKREAEVQKVQPAIILKSLHPLNDSLLSELCHILTSSNEPFSAPVYVLTVFTRVRVDRFRSSKQPAPSVLERWS